MLSVDFFITKFKGNSIKEGKDFIKMVLEQWDVHLQNNQTNLGRLGHLHYPLIYKFWHVKFLIT